VSSDPQLAQVIDNAEFMNHNHNKDVELSELFKLNPERFLGTHYIDHFAKINPKLRTQMAFLFKLLAVDMALSI
jgi:mannose-6-phosphate isomerase class I